MNATARTASQLYNRPTSYEIVATDGARSVRIAFSARKTKQALFQNLCANGPAIAAEFDLNPENAVCESATSKAIVMVDGTKRVSIKFSGRTEREFAELI